MGIEDTCTGKEDCFYFQEYQHYKKGLRAAKEIQKLLLGEIPQIMDIDIGHTFLPSEEISGDFLNVSLFENDQNHLYIADATGHGVAAAAIMLTARAYIKALNKQHTTISSLISNVNELLCSDKLKSKFVTLFYGSLNLKNKEFSYTCAGHNPPLLFKRDPPQVIELRPTGIVLGISPQAKYKEVKLQLEKKDMLLMYTDGITERRNAQGQDFATSEISKIVLAHAQESAQHICDIILEEAKKYSARSEQDDMTLLMFKVL